MKEGECRIFFFFFDLDLSLFTPLTPRARSLAKRYTKTTQSLLEIGLGTARKQTDKKKKKSVLFSPFLLSIIKNDFGVRAPRSELHGKGFEVRLRGRSPPRFAHFHHPHQKLSSMESENTATIFLSVYSFLDLDKKKTFYIF